MSGATVDFDVTQAGGKAKVAIQSGSITLPGMLEEPQIGLNSLTSEMSWQVNGDKIAVNPETREYLERANA